ncbi:non-ribosomal peptide synthetase [Streptomyces griseoflavus]|uniref:non-ribosomal peptide synthetase n=1 Tax=Streptomyces griseoflavus TaxID=35619 RepID=UPI003D751143
MSPSQPASLTREPPLPAVRPSPSGGDDDTVLRLLRDRVARTPDRTAVESPGSRLTYGELWNRADRLAEALPRLGVRPGGAVGVAVDRSWQSVCCLLAVLRAGAHYVPLDGGYPPGHLRTMAASAAVDTVIGRSAALSRFPEGVARHRVHVDLALADPGAPPCARPLPDERTPAYVIHTSGSSTGRPRPVVVPHRALRTAASSLGAECAFTADDRILSFASMSWDTFGEELYGALSSGAALVMEPRAHSGSVPGFLAAVERRSVTVVDLPTSYWREMVDHLSATREPLPPCLRLVIIGGEAVSAEAVRAWCAAVPDRVRLLNTYGQTETVLVTHAAELGGPHGRALTPGAPVPIGRPLAHVRQRIIDPGPTGRGELAVGGASLAWGYLDAPAATAARFVPDPDGGRMYLTGDIVEPAADGTLLYICRKDRQVKIRGIRVEPEETERMLLTHPRLTDAAVVAERPDGGTDRLHAFVAGPDLDAGALRAWLGERLPAHLVPARVSVRRTLPTLPNGKVDRTMLTEAAHTEPDRLSRTVQEVSDLCGAVLDTACGAEDDFFDKGGDSLLTTRLISRVYRRYDVELTYVDVFEARTPAAVAELILARATRRPERQAPRGPGR